MIPTFLASALLIFCICQPALSQPSDRTIRPPAVANHVEPSPAATNSSRKPVSAQAKAEADRLYKEGVKYARGGLPKQAVQIFSRAIKLNPESADAYYGLAYSYFELKQWEKALDSVRQLLKLNPNDVDGGWLLVNIEDAQQRESESISREKTEAVKSAKEQAQGVQVAVDVATVPITPKESEATDENLTRIYRVGAGDVLDIKMAEAPSSQTTLFTVNASGVVDYPNLLDPVAVAGLTTEEITIALQSALKRNAVEAATVRVSVRDYGSHAILVSGLAKETGTKIMRREAIPLYVVIADAQPLPEAARLTLVRSQSNQSFDIELNQTKEINQLVFPGDVITFYPGITKFFYVGGEVKEPGEKTFRRGLTLTQALIVAGGATQRSKEAEVARDDGNGFLVVSRFKLKDIYSGKLRDPLIQAGDRIMVLD